MKSDSYGAEYMRALRKRDDYRDAFNVYKREWRRKRKQLGLCGCGKVVAVGSNRCEGCRDRRRSYEREHQQEINIRKRKWEAENRDKVIIQKRESGRRANARLKNEIIEAYGGKCVCCGETTTEFMTIDHAYGRANDQEPRRTGKDLYRWLKKMGFPQDGFQLMCFNCNSARGFLGRCPHEGKSTGRWNRVYGLIQVNGRQ